MTNLLDLITPTNLEVEREKFFAQANYNPIFHYIWQDQKIDPVFGIKKKYPLWDSIKQQDHYLIMESASDLFEVRISEDMVDRALQVSGTEGDRSTGDIKDLVSAFSEAFTYFNLDYTTKVVSDSGFNIRPKHESQELIISNKIHFEYFSVNAEVHHELVHILRYVNGKHNEVARSQRFLATEEGLASWCQDHTNNDLSQVQHAMEYVASAVGIGSGLREVYECFVAMGTSKELAWKRACRHKFGFVDTSLPGDILKPAMYFDSSEKVSKLTTDEKVRLFRGKIAISELAKYPTYSGLWPADKLISYFKL